VVTDVAMDADVKARALVSRRILPRQRRVRYSSLRLARYDHRFLTHMFSRYIFTLEGKDTLVSASDPQPVRIPARARHTFKVDDSHEGPCTVEISTDVSPMAPGSQPDAEGASAKL
jgi:hypothetical protein